MNIRHNPYIMLSILFLCFSLSNRLSSGIDNISGNQSLSGDQTIVSSGGIFELGFFQPGNSSNFYIGMWYKNLSVHTVVWVANREIPISNKYTSQLKILNGNLVLLNQSQTTVWSTNMNSASANSVVATLHDNGNFVLEDGSSSTQPIWQSFDYPTHTFLPGSKIGFNNFTNRSTFLTSWNNLEDPSTGLFSLQLDQIHSRYTLQWNRSTYYWSSGDWNGEKFSLVPEMSLDSIYNFSYVSNENGSYFTYSLYDVSIISRLIMDISGQIKQLIWLNSTSEWSLFWIKPIQLSDIYGYCGAFGIYNDNVQQLCSCLSGFVPKYLNDWDLGIFSRGCVRKTSLQCAEDNTYIGKETGFQGISHMAFPGATYGKSVQSRAECESYCLSRCECYAYAYHPETGMCQYWNFTLFRLQQLADTVSAGMTLYFRTAASEFSSPNNTNTTTPTPSPPPTAINHNNKAVVIGSIIGSVVGSVAVIGLVIFWRWNNIHGGRNKSFKTRFVLLKRHANLLNNDVTQGESSDVPFFHLESIIAATDGFSVANKLGQGGFGPVYKGNLPNGEKIAVKSFLITRDKAYESSRTKSY